MLKSPDVVMIEVDGEFLSEEDANARARTKLDAIYQSITRGRDRWIQYRAASGVEQEWRTAQALYDGTADTASGSSLMDTARNGPSAKRSHNGSRSKVVVNIVRPKVDQVTARLCEILLPTDDQNWGIQPTPLPELYDIVRDPAAQEQIDTNTGKPISAVATDLIAESRKRAVGMETAIDDALVECNFNAESRGLIEHGVQLGTGIMKGPFPKVRSNAQWMRDQLGQFRQSVSSDIVPASREVSCWDLYPDPGCGNNPQRGRGLWERSQATRKELRGLVGIPGYDAATIRLVLQERPQRIVAAAEGLTRTESEDDTYELWEYHGEVDEDSFNTLSDRGGDPLEVQSGVLVCVNDKVIGALESWVSDGSVPYDFWCYRERATSPFGLPYPLELEHQQRVVNAAWRQVMDNAAASAGYQVIMKKGAVSPVNNQMQFESRKFWYANDEVADVTKAFHILQIDSKLDELLKIATTAMQFADQESSTPQMLAGTAKGGGAPETLGAMQILQGNATGPIRWRVKRYDDRITRPHLSRHFDWQMTYSKDDSIKGDMRIDARGASALLERDIAHQATLNLAAITNSPRYAPLLKVREELIMILKAMKIDPESFVKPQEQVDAEAAETAKQPPPMDPKIQVAQMVLQGKQLEVNEATAARAQSGEIRQAELGMKHEQIAYQQQKEQGEFQIAMTDAELQKNLTLAQMADARASGEEQIAAKNRLEGMKIESKHQLFNAEAALRVRTGQGI